MLNKSEKTKTDAMHFDEHDNKKKIEDPAAPVMLKGITQCRMQVRCMVWRIVKKEKKRRKKRKEN